MSSVRMAIFLLHEVTRREPARFCIDIVVRHNFTKVSRRVVDTYHKNRYRCNDMNVFRRPCAQKTLKLR
jgi:hypothetical protein